MAFPFVRTDLTRVLHPLHEIWRTSYKAPPGTGISGGGLKLFILHHTALWWGQFWQGPLSSRKETFYLTPSQKGLVLCPLKTTGRNAGLTMERGSLTGPQPLPDFAIADEQLSNMVLSEQNSFPGFAVPLFHCFLAGWGLQPQKLFCHFAFFFSSSHVIPCENSLPSCLCSQGAHVAQRVGMATILSLS